MDHGVSGVSVGISAEAAAPQVTAGCQRRRKLLVLKTVLGVGLFLAFSSDLPAVAAGSGVQQV